MRLTATLLRFGEDTTPDMFGDVIRFAEGSLYTDDHQRVGLFVSHDTSRTAAGVCVDLYVEGDALRGVFDTLDNEAGRALESELAAGVRWDVSVGVLLDDSVDEVLDPEGSPFGGPSIRTTVTSADLAEVSTCLRGRMPSARVDEVSTEPVGSNA